MGLVSVWPYSQPCPHTPSLLAPVPWVSCCSPALPQELSFAPGLCLPYLSLRWCGLHRNCLRSRARRAKGHRSQLCGCKSDPAWRHGLPWVPLREAISAWGREALGLIGVGTLCTMHLRPHDFSNGLTLASRRWEMGSVRTGMGWMRLPFMSSERGLCGKQVLSC